MKRMVNMPKYQKSKRKTKRSAKSTEIRQRYMKERKRIQNILSRLNKEGYVSNRDILPPIPKKVTEGSIRRLQKITPSKVRQKSVYLNRETGEIIDSGDINRIKEEQDNRLRELEYDYIINNFMEEIRAINNILAEELIGKWLESFLSTSGKEFVAQTLENTAKQGIRLQVEEYDSLTTVKQKSISFIKETLELSEEYSEKAISDIIESLDMEIW